MTERTCSILGCERLHEARGWCDTHYARWKRTGVPGEAALRHRPLGMTLSEAFHYLMPGDPPDEGCWIWSRSRNPDGYGIIGFQKKHIGAHRVSYEIFKGSIPNGLDVLHHCDNPPCCNPKHLYVGLPTLNSQHMVIRNRQWNQKLTADDIPEIRRRHAEGESQASLGRSYGVRGSAIGKVIHGETWSYV